MTSDTSEADRNLALAVLEKRETAPAQTTPAALHALAQRLKGQQQLSYARRIYEFARARDPIADPALRRKMRQQHAVCTYKDPDCARERALDDALAILDSDPSDSIRTTTDPETLGIAGAIHKRKWEIDGQSVHLARSLAYYRRGCAAGIGTADGYPAINAAFVLDLLASVERTEAERVGAPTPAVAERERDARTIREELVGILSPRFPNERRLTHGDWWPLVTLAEACTGLERWGDAAAWVQRAVATGPDPWEREATARQLAALLRLRMGGDVERFARSPAAAVLEPLVPRTASRAALLSAFAGKVGLALSGGGFRASLFHLGVLAKLAELDFLRHVEVISCVSGGSIVGAHYYLELKRAFEKKEDGELSPKDYVDLVSTVQCRFLAGVQRDLRNKAFLDPRSLLRLALRGENRTLRIADLFDRYLFGQDGEPATNRLRDLTIAPGGDAAFHPRRDNWLRDAKVPMLILNATTLNTGHNWQFTASFMGEPPFQIEQEIDTNERLRRMYLKGEAPPPHGDIGLGVAVAASACVPGLFRPITLKGLYPDRKVRLVDGGVHDNQGVYGLLEQDCNVLIVSDASGQMQELSSPPWLPLNVLKRTNDVLMATVRCESYRHLDALRRGGRVREQVYLHLRKELDGAEVGWMRPPPGATDTTRDEELTSYRIPRGVQRLLSALRTDLDRFSDDEAYCLMLSGYRMTEHELPKAIRSLRTVPQKARWDFLAVEAKLDPKSDLKPLMQTLRIGQHRLFRRLRGWLARA